jgi:hypothetical protein
MSAQPVRAVFFDDDPEIEPVLALAAGLEIIAAVPMSNADLLDLAGKMLVAAAPRMGFKQPEVTPAPAASRMH